MTNCNSCGSGRYSAGSFFVFNFSWLRFCYKKWLRKRFRACIFNVFSALKLLQFLLHFCLKFCIFYKFIVNVSGNEKSPEPLIFPAPDSSSSSTAYGNRTHDLAVRGPRSDQYLQRLRKICYNFCYFF